MSRWTRWIPAAAVPAVIAAGSVVVAAQAGAAPDLPDLTAEEVLALAAGHSVEAFSGTFEQASDLGLPDLGLPSGPPGAPGGGEDPAGALAEGLALLTASRTVRVYADGPENLRVQLLDRFAEVDIVRSAEEVWVYDSAENAATRFTSGADAGAHTGPGHGDLADVPAPEDLAAAALAAVEPSTEVSVARHALVAGRPVYELVLDPRTPDTLVESVTLAVDAETGFPLAASVRAVGQEAPALSLAYTSFAPGAPAADLFVFEPPPGAQVVEHEVGFPGGDLPSGDLPAGPHTGAAGAPTVVGSGWDAVLVAPPGGAELPDDPLVDQLTTAVDGGRVLATAVFTVLLTDDGRVLAGAVPVERLLAVAGP